MLFIVQSLFGFGLFIPFFIYFVVVVIWSGNLSWFLDSNKQLQDGRVSAVIPPPRTPPPPPPPLPPTKTVTLEAREARMSLEERMRLVLGCGTEVETNQNTFSGSTPPPPPPPPLLTSDRGEPRRSRPPVSVATVSSTSNVISSRGRTPPPPRAAAALSSTQSTRTKRLWLQRLYNC